MELPSTAMSIVDHTGITKCFIGGLIVVHDWQDMRLRSNRSVSRYVKCRCCAGWEVFLSYTTCPRLALVAAVVCQAALREGYECRGPYPPVADAASSLICDCDTPATKRALLCVPVGQAYGTLEQLSTGW